MKNPENFALHIRLVELANIIINNTINAELTESINNLLDKNPVGRSIEEIEKDIQVAYEEGQLFDPETLEQLREKNKRQAEKLSEQTETLIVEEATEEPKTTRKSKKDEAV